MNVIVIYSYSFIIKPSAITAAGAFSVSVATNTNNEIPTAIVPKIPKEMVFEKDRELVKYELCPHDINSFTITLNVSIWIRTSSLSVNYMHVSGYEPLT